MHKHVLTAFYYVIVLQVYEAVLCRPASGMPMPKHCRHCRSDAVSGPIYSASWDLYCNQTAGRIRMPLSTKVGVGLDHIVLHWDTGSSHKGQGPLFSAHVYCGQTVAHLNYC